MAFLKVYGQHFSIYIFFVALSTFTELSEINFNTCKSKSYIFQLIILFINPMSQIPTQRGTNITAASSTSRGATYSATSQSMYTFVLI